MYKKQVRYFAFLLCIVCLCACQQKTEKIAIRLSWDFIGNDIEPNICEAFLTIHNLAKQPLEGGKIVNGGFEPAWGLYYAHMSVKPLSIENEALHIEQIMASYHCITPTEQFATILAGDSCTFRLRWRGNMLRESNAPEGFFLVTHKNGKPQKNPMSVECTYAKYNRLEQMVRGIESWEKTPYSDGEYVFEQNKRFTSHTFDTTNKIVPTIPTPKKIIYQKGQCDLNKAVLISNPTANMLPEGYTLRITQDTIFIDACDERGIFYAQQTLQQIRFHQSIVPACTIIDHPDMVYRGFMLDIARNFTPKKDIMTLIESLSTYKINTLHLHLADDEAWRLEIKDFPELTQVASKRGFEVDKNGNLTEDKCLYPFYAGGWNEQDPNNIANGYLTREDFIDILHFAQQHAMRVIPEIDMPGHMRACKKALKGKLTDSLLEQRQYLSAQHYTDNVIAITNPFALTFVEKVVGDIVSMYKEANCDLSIFNIGGDEVPKGALTQEEHQQFMDSVLAILQKHNLQPAGWEEISHFCEPKTNAISYCWHENDAKPKELLQKGYPVVLCQANHLYFDFAYCNHHEEKGLMWGGYTDEWRAFSFKPIQQPHVLGMQAQLWAEVIRSYLQIEWQIFPKIFGLSERAWNNRSVLSLDEFNSIVYDYVLPFWASGKHNFHLPLVGIHVNDNKITLNSPVQNGILQYCLDKNSTSFDSLQWCEYKGPFVIDEQVQLVRAKICYLGKQSNVTWHFLEK